MLIPPLKRVFALMQSLELMPQCVLERIVLLQAVQLNRRGKYRERSLQFNPALSPAASPVPCTHPHCSLWLGAEEPVVPAGGWAASGAAGCVPVASALLRSRKSIVEYLVIPASFALCWFESLSSCWEGLSMCPGNRGAWGESHWHHCMTFKSLHFLKLHLFWNNWDNIFGEIETLRKFVERARIKLW